MADGAAGFGQGSSGPALLRDRPASGRRFAYGAVTLYGPPFQGGSATTLGSTTAALQPRARLDARGLGYSPFARRYLGSHCCFPFLRLLRCFSSAGWQPGSGWRASGTPGFPIRTSADQRPFAPPRGFSQPAASFFASGSQGIPRAPSGTCRAPAPVPPPSRPRDHRVFLALARFSVFIPSVVCLSLRSAARSRMRAGY